MANTNKLTRTQSVTNHLSFFLNITEDNPTDIHNNNTIPNTKNNAPNKLDNLSTSIDDYK